MEVQNIGDDRGKDDRGKDNNGRHDPSDSIQLSNLSAVLNGLDAGAQVMRHKAHRVMMAVRSGTYQINPAQLSSRIVGEFLGRA